MMMFVFLQMLASRLTCTMIPDSAYKRTIAVKAGTCARDRRALQQLALNVHVKHSDFVKSSNIFLKLQQKFQ